MSKIRIRFKLKSGQWTYWLSADEVVRYRSDFIECAVIEETMSYDEAMKVLEKNFKAQQEFAKHGCKCYNEEQRKNCKTTCGNKNEVQ